MTATRLAVLVPALALSLSLAGCSSPPSAFDHAPLSADALKYHVSVLAADDMQGRETGSAGALRAAAYIGSVLERAGWARAGQDGGYLQGIGMAGWRTKGELTATFEGPGGAQFDARHGVDLRWLRGPPRQATLDLVPVDSLEALPAQPDAQSALLLLTDGRTAMEWLGPSRGQGWGALVIMGPSSAGEPQPRPDSLLGASDDPVLLMARGPLVQRLRDGAFDVLHLVLESEPPVLAANVVGLLPGTSRPDEVIVLSAHYDHIGLAEDGEDRVFNGADDDASGVAVVLELARALAANGRRPERTIVALLVTGEERGLLGSRAYVQAAPVPLAYTVADLNFEMLGRPDPLLGGAGQLWLTGWERTDLGPALEAAGLPVVADPRPQQNYFGRSDNISFAREGIPAQTLSSFGEHADYHQVSDEIDTLDYEHLERAAAVAWAITRQLANGALTPHWLPDGRP